MTWPAGFLSDLDDEKHAISLRLVLAPETSPVLLTPGPAAQVVLTNYPETDSYNCLGKVCRTTGASLDPWTWRYTMGQLEIGFVAERSVAGVVVKDQILRDILDADIVRGTVVELWVGFDSIDNTDFERVFLGVLHDIRSERGMGARTSFRIIARDATALMQTVSNSISTVGALFTTTYTVQEVLTIAYTVGDGTLTMADTTGFEFEAGGTGLVLLDNGTDEPFLLTYTGITATTLTGCSATGQFGTTAANGLATLAHVALLQDHPINILRKILTTTAAGTNGSWDTLPTDWGAALPIDYVDTADMGDWVTATDSAEVWNVVVEEAVPNPLTWIEGIWGRAGIFLVHCQGSITCRAAQDVTGSPTETTGITITDSTITAVEEWSAFDAAQPWEYTSVSVVNGGDPRILTPQELFLEENSIVYSFTTILPGTSTVGSTSAEAAQTKPSQEEKLLDLSRCLWGPGYVAGNERVRMAQWYLDVRESMTLFGRGLSWARFCPGDVINVTTSLAFGWAEADAAGAGTYSAAQVMVTGGADVDWLAGTCKMRVARLPDRDP